MEAALTKPESLLKNATGDKPASQKRQQQPICGRAALESVVACVNETIGTILLTARTIALSCVCNKPKLHDADALMKSTRLTELFHMSSSVIPSESVLADISRGGLIKFAMILCTFVIDAALLTAFGLQILPYELIRPFAVSVVLLSGAWWYQKKNEPAFVLSLFSLTQVVLFTTSFTILMYCCAAMNAPLVDQQLRSIDLFLGVDIAAIKAWCDAQPTLQLVLTIAYNSMILQTAMVVIVLGFTERRMDLENFVLQFMATTLVSAVCFALLPAESTCGTYGYAPSEAQQLFLNDLHAIRSGQQTVISLTNAQGLITIPSYHTTWAILLAWSLRNVAWFRYPVLLLNVAVVAATMALGWHYFIDIITGALLAAAGIGLTTRLNTWMYDSEGRSRTVA